MSAFQNFYDVLKELIKLAKQVRNQEVVDLALDLQEKFFELREENDELNYKIKELVDKLNDLEKANVLEKDIKYYEKGFLTLNTDKIKIPYCSLCWKKEHKLMPLSQRGAWFQYRCGNCHTDVTVMSETGKGLNEKDN